MPKYSKRSSDNLSQSHPDLQTVFNTVIKYYDCSVICGHREEIYQNKAYHSGKSKVKFPNSRHNKTPAMAVDVAPYPIDWDDEQRFRDFGNYVIGVADGLYDIGMIKHRIGWGRDWDGDHDLDDQDFNDSPHYYVKEV